MIFKKMNPKLAIRVKNLIFLDVFQKECVIFNHFLTAFLYLNRVLQTMQLFHKVKVHQ